MSTGRSGRRGWTCAAILATTLAATLGPLPALAHGAPPNVTAVLDGVRPPIPGALHVQVVDAGAPELLVANPTRESFTVLDRSGQPFLRISAAGVQANLASADWYATFAPETLLQPPSDQRVGGPPRWVVASTGDSWGWYDTRIQPSADQVSAADAKTTHPLRLADWSVPVRYGSVSALITGHFELEPLLGSYLVLADPAPDGLSVTPLQGVLPGLLLVDAVRRAVTVFGVDGRPFIRFVPAPAGDSTAMIVAENEGSRSYAIDHQARGLAPPVGVPAVDWTTVGTGYSVSWLDPRLDPPSVPPSDAGRTSRGGSWRIPITVAGRATSLAGFFTWEPAGAAGEPAGERAAGERLAGERAARPTHPPAATVLGVAIAGLVVLAAGAVGFGARRRRVRRRAT